MSDDREMQFRRALKRFERRVVEVTSQASEGLITYETALKSLEGHLKNEFGGVNYLLNKEKPE